jgi:hypothetical protein
MPHNFLKSAEPGIRSAADDWEGNELARAIRWVSLVVLWAAPAVVLSLSFSTDWVSVWKKLHVPSLRPYFTDLRSITSGVKTQQEGGDPLVKNPYDPWNRTLNYPRVWVYLFQWLGINDNNVWVVGIAFCALYLACVSWLILHSRGAPDGFVLVIAALSVSPLLGIERGNTDLFVFSVTFLGCAAANSFLKTGALLSAAQLKVFPYAGMMVDAARRPRKEKAIAVAGALLSAILFAWQWNDLKAIRHSTPISTASSFGLLTLRRKVMPLNEIAVACVWIIAVSIAAMAWVLRPKLEQAAASSRFKEMFFVFGGIYLFTFFVGSNWDYRLIFLLPTLPLSLEMARDSRHRGWGILYVAAVLIAENTMASDSWLSFYLADLSTIVIFFLILALFLEETKNFTVKMVAGFRKPGMET